MNVRLLSDQVPKDAEELVAILLCNREVRDAEAFLHPKHPKDLTYDDVGIDGNQIARAVERLKEAKERHEKVIIFGDYDCDGVCATAVLWETLHEWGLNVFPFLPHRQRHGYGLSEQAVSEILRAGKPAILISVDNGIVAHEQWKRLGDEGVFTILTDHHEPEKVLPPADVIIHTSRLCGTTVAWLLACAVDKKKAATILDLCAIATIADQVPLLGANRSFAQYGLTQLNKTTRLGLSLLIEAGGLTRGDIDAHAINFVIAPRINAAGRLDDALTALQLLCTKNEERARRLVSQIQQTNETRQEITQRAIELAREAALRFAQERIIVVYDTSFHEGIIGLIASRLTEEFGKPSIVISVGEETSKASCRSVAGVHITNVLRSLRDDLLEIGGHPMAAGFRIRTSRIDIFVDHLVVRSRELIAADALTPEIEAECKLPTSLLTIRVARELQVLLPHGMANREPLFLFSDFRIVAVRRIGADGGHIKMRLSSTGDSPVLVDAIGFGMGSKELPRVETVIDCVGNMRINTWNGKQSLQINLKAIL